MVTRHNKRWLLTTAKHVALQLKTRRAGTPLRVRMPYRIVPTNTDGWRVIVGDLGDASQPRLEVWLDRFPGYENRKLYACFYSWKNANLLKLTKKVARKLPPVRVVSEADTTDGLVMLNHRLRRSEFNLPILEKYSDATFFGIYDQTPPSVDLNRSFCDRAIAFFEEVSRAASGSNQRDESHDVYPQYENRRRVVSHLRRERSTYLAVERKLLDGFKCQACAMRFQDVYGEKLGAAFAEAHHLIPLSKLKGRVRTEIEDLRTVCANCHRMLHKMEGKRDDIVKLRAILKRSRRGRRKPK